MTLWVTMAASDEKECDNAGAEPASATIAEVVDQGGPAAGQCFDDGRPIPAADPTLDMKRVRPVLALGRMGEWLSMRARPPVIPPLGLYIGEVLKNEAMPPE